MLHAQGGASFPHRLRRGWSSKGGVSKQRQVINEISMSDDVHEAMLAAGWSDGLPIVPPTVERVEIMLRGTSRDPAEVVGDVPPMYSPATIGNIAANAVLAGCSPEHLRLVIAGVEAMLLDEFNLHGVHATTMGATPCLIVSGSARKECGLNTSHGALGSGSRANACIGRALKLVLQNVGGAKLGGTESTTLGTPCKFTLCVAEAEEALLAGWRPYHAESRGFNLGDSAVTVISCTSGPMQLVDFATRDVVPLLRSLGSHLGVCYAAHMYMACAESNTARSPTQTRSMLPQARVSSACGFFVCVAASGH